MQVRKITAEEQLRGSKVFLRLLTLDDCTSRYEEWLRDPVVNEFLETRWTPQPLSSIRDFVKSKLESIDSYLFAIVEIRTLQHVGNLKVGPINFNHSFADISYFIGERSAWGKGFATESITLATDFAFSRLKLHRMQAGAYASNVGSCKALQNSGYRPEAIFKQQLRTRDGQWEDHHWYALLRTEWQSRGPIEFTSPADA